MSKILVKNLVDEVVEGYLFNDVENMLNIKLNKDEKYGAAGYPVVMAINAGIELLGTLCSSLEYNKNKGNDYFCYYWQNALKNISNEYGLESIDKLVYNLVRHGIDHLYAAKLGIEVAKTNQNNHLHINRKTNTLTINIATYYKDFKKSYFDYFKPLLNSTGTKAVLQSRLDSIIEGYKKDSKNFFDTVYNNNSAYFKTQNYIANSFEPNPFMANASVPWSAPPSGIISAVESKD